jgi:hypothetical protein
MNIDVTLAELILDLLYNGTFRGKDAEQLVHVRHQLQQLIYRLEKEEE